MDLKDLSARKCDHERFTARCFISSCLGLSNPCTTSTNPVNDLHFDTKNNGCIDHLRLYSETKLSLILDPNSSKYSSSVVGVGLTRV